MRRRESQEGNDSAEEDMKTLEINKVRQGKSLVVNLRGSIIEGSKALVAGVIGEPDGKNSPVIFDFHDVTIINSIGIGEWVELLQEIAPERVITYRRCPPNVVDTFNLVPAFLGRAVVEDLYADFQCASCSHEARQLLTVATDLSKNGELLKKVECQQCGGSMETAEPEEDVFAFTLLVG